MSEIKRITCDACGGDLSETGNTIDYRIVLKSEEIPRHDGMLTMMHIEPAYKNDKHFCHKKCLKDYINGEL